MNNFLAKPFRLEEIRTLLEGYITPHSIHAR
jgi:hypothetical protein